VLNYATQRTLLIRNLRLKTAALCHVNLTPASASRLIQVERFFAAGTEKN
jgi:hypothetical protein